jgi:hypothetical protein
MISIIKGDAFKKLIISNNGICKSYLYDNWEEFIKILEENYYYEIMNCKKNYNS